MGASPMVSGWHGQLYSDARAVPLPNPSKIPNKRPPHPRKQLPAHPSKDISIFNPSCKRRRRRAFIARKHQRWHLASSPRQPNLGERSFKLLKFDSAVVHGNTPDSPACVISIPTHPPTPPTQTAPHSL